MKLIDTENITPEMRKIADRYGLGASALKQFKDMLEAAPAVSAEMQPVGEVCMVTGMDEAGSPCKEKGADFDIDLPVGTILYIRRI